MIYVWRILDGLLFHLYSLVLSFFGYWRWLDWLHSKVFNLRFRAEAKRTAKVYKWRS